MKKHKPIQSGDVFNVSAGGSCTVIEYKSQSCVIIEFNDRHKHRATVWAHQLRAGKVKNPYTPIVLGVGYFGHGPHRAAIDGSMTPAYKAWRNMLKRAYCEKSKALYPTYSECSVSPEWHNFQVFAEWFCSQPNGSTPGFALDKDLIELGSKVYAAEFCSFVPAEINTLLLDCGASRGDLPQGVYYCSQKKMFAAQVKIDGKTTSLGRYANPELASMAYKAAKTANVARMAEKYKDVLHPKVYENLRNWTL